MYQQASGCTIVHASSPCPHLVELLEIASVPCLSTRLCKIRDETSAVFVSSDCAALLATPACMFDRGCNAWLPVATVRTLSN